MAGGVDDVDVVLFPASGRRGGGDCDAAFALLSHPIHYRRAFVYAADFVNPAGKEQHPLGHGCLASVNMGNEPNIADIF